MVQIKRIYNQDFTKVATTNEELQDLLLESSDTDFFQVNFEEVIVNKATTSVLSLSQRLKGQTNYIQQKETKSLNMTLNYDKVSLISNGFNIGYSLDVTINEQYLFIEQIPKGVQIVSKDNNMLLEPNIDPSNNLLLLYYNENINEKVPMFRVLTFNEGPSSATIRDEKPVSSGAIPYYSKELRDSSNNNRKTSGFQSYLNGLYSKIIKLLPEKLENFNQFAEDNLVIKEEKVEVKISIPEPV